MWQSPVDGDALAARLLALAPRIRARLRPTPSLAEEWAPIGIEVADVTMSARGSCSPASGSRAIFVNANDRLPLQRFTVAHELGHLILAPPRSSMRVLDPDAEESLCDRFARMLLFPPECVPAAVRAAPTPEAILRLCGLHRLNVRPVLRAVGEVLSAGRHHLLLARWSGHRMRPYARDFRIADAAGNPHVFIPFGERLVSAGLATLASQARHADHLDRFAGSDEDVVVRLRNLPGERSSDVRRGPVRWQAQLNGRADPLVIVVLDLVDVLPRELSRRAYAPEMRKAAS